MTDLTEVHTMFAERRRLEWWEERMMQGEALLLHRQLVHRFGPLPDWVETKLAAAAEAELLHWGEGVVDAKTLGELFGG